MDSGSVNNAPQVNGNGKNHPLNPDAREFIPRQDFVVNNNKQKQNVSTTAAAARTTTAATTATTTAGGPTPHYYPYRPAPVVPVVYPSVHGTPGTIFFMPMHEVPSSAVLLPMPTQNGHSAEMAFYYRIAQY